jgi:hypothetical protein
MSRGDNSPGLSRLASAFRGIAGGKNEMTLDFGKISNNGSLTTNNFPVPIPRGSYHVCKHLLPYSIKVSNTTYQTTRGLQHGDRVLVAWVGGDAVVIDVVVKASAIV